MKNGEWEKESPYHWPLNMFLLMFRLSPAGKEMMLTISVLRVLFSRLFSVFWGYHKQGSCQAGMSAAISKVNII